MECPDKTQVALFAGGHLPETEVLRIEAHLDDCEGCLALIADAATARSGATVAHDVDGGQDSAWIYLVAALARRSDRPPPSEDAEPPSRERIGPYLVKGILGRGGMGIVYRTVHEETNQDAAVKTVVGSNPKALSAMRQEIAFLRSQHHPGIIRVFEDGLVDGDPWYAMELLEGRTLEDFNRSLWANRGERAGGDRLGDVLALYIRLCGPLAFVHREGVVHCDLKPANVFIRSDEQPVLMDFGLLSRAGGAVGREVLETGGHLRGTLPYIPPELIRGQIPDARADLYALGCLLYESLTGRPPFQTATVNALLDAHLTKEATPASRLVSGVPPKLDELLGALLAKRPDQRIGDADVVAEQLSSLLHQPSRPPSPPPKPYLFRPRMVGRDAVIGRLEALLAGAAEGDGRLVLLRGESGIGKTFLASEVAQRAARAGFDVVTGECAAIVPTGQTSGEIVGAAFEPLRTLLQNAADRCRDEGYSAAVRLFGSEQTIRVLARYEPALGHFCGDAPADDLAQLPPPAERERALRALSDLLERMTEDRPLLLIVDDLQWADDLSLAFLASLSARSFAGKRLLVFALYRTEEAAAPIAELERKEHAQTIRLGRLDPSALTVLVGDLLSARPPAAFVDRLAADSEGNPFFVAEYLRAAAAEGLLERTAEGWRLNPATTRAALEGEELALPRTLRALLERRLALLNPATQRVTEAAAVLGRELRIPLLVRVAGGTAEEIEKAIAEMIERQVVEAISADAVRFLHDKTREAAYARIGSARRASLHRVAAEAIESSHAGGPELAARYAELAYHLRRAGDARRAVDYFERAGDHALRNSANADAVRLLGEASQLVAMEPLQISAGRRASWARMTGDAYHGLGELQDSKRHLLHAVELLGWPMPERPSRIGSAIAANLARQVLHRVTPRHWFEASPSESPVLLEGARAYDRLEQIYYYRGEYGPLFLANLTTLNLSERALPSSHLAAAYTNAAAAAGIIPLRGTASRYFALAEATLSQAYDAEVESYLRLLQAVYSTGLGECGRAAASADRALGLADRLGFRRRWEEAAGVRCGATSDFDERLDWAKRIIDSAQRRDDPQMTSWGLLCGAEVLAARGDFPGASENVARVEEMLPRIGAPEQMWALAMRSFVLLAERKVGEAASFADRAAALVKQTRPIHVGGIEAYARIAQVQLAAWASAPARRAAERRSKARAACADLATAARIFPMAAPSYCLHEGARRWMLGQSARALSMWERGLLEARRLHLPYREAQLLLTMGRRGGAGGDRAAHALRLGQEIASRLAIGGSPLLVLDASAHAAQ